MTDNLAQKIGELEHVGSLQARFVSDVSHELRTPLATVRMAADYIHAARAGLPPDAQRAAVLLERELERFENLLEDLLEISRFDAGVINLEPVEVDLAGLLDEVVDALDPIAHGRKVDVALEVDRSQGLPLVAADPRRLDRVFSNLVKNAIEHTVEGGVRIWVGRRARDVVVTVADEGEGIPAEDLPHIFERFYRADVHRARTLGGTGLGLAIALENVNLHRGSIDVQSEVGQGSTFTVTLPATDPGRAGRPGGRAAARSRRPSRRSPSVGSRPSAASSARSPRWSPCSGWRPARPACPRPAAWCRSARSRPRCRRRTPTTSGTSAARPRPERGRGGDRLHAGDEHRRRLQDPAVGAARVRNQVEHWSTRPPPCGCTASSRPARC